MYTFYRLLNFGIRQITGNFEDLWTSKNLKIKVPSFGHLSDLFTTLPIQVKQYCNRLAVRIKNGESITLIFDSSGFQWSHSSSWYETKYNKPCKQSPWRKLRISMDPEHNMYGVEVTESMIHDITMMKPLMWGDTIPSVNRVIADAGYYIARFIQSGYALIFEKPLSSLQLKGFLIIKAK